MPELVRVSSLKDSRDLVCLFFFFVFSFAVVVVVAPPETTEWRSVKWDHFV